MIFPRILFKVTFFRIVLAGVVSALVSFRREMVYALAWLSVGELGEASASASLISYESVFSTCLFTVASMDLLLFGRLFSRTFVRTLMLGFLSFHFQSSSFWSLDKVAYSGGL